MNKKFFYINIEHMPYIKKYASAAEEIRKNITNAGIKILEEYESPDDYTFFIPSKDTNHKYETIKYVKKDETIFYKGKIFSIENLKKQIKNEFKNIKTK